FFPQAMKKKNQTAEVPADNLLSGVIRFDFDKISTLCFSGRYSNLVEIGGAVWMINVCKVDRYEYGDDMCVYIESMEYQPTKWLIDLNAKITLFNSDNRENISVCADMNLFYGALLNTICQNIT
ncbi:hypothetical protein PENTCL1PPCAC_23831, partial [Pristionchus entomophagus]